MIGNSLLLLAVNQCWLKRCLCSCLFFSCLTSNALAGVDYQLKEILLPLKTIGLPTEPISVELNNELIIVHSVDDNADHHLDLLDSVDLSSLNKRKLELAPLQLELTADQKNIVLIGKAQASDESATRLEILDMNLKTVGLTSTEKAFVSPASFIGEDDLLYVYDRASRNSNTSGKGLDEATVYDLSDRKKPVMVETRRFPSHRYGVEDFWLLNDAETAVINSAYRTSMDAFEVASGAPLDSFSYQFGKKSGFDEVQPFNVFALSDHPNCKQLASRRSLSSSFIVVSNATRELLFTSFDNKFKSMQINSTIPISISRPASSSINYLAGTDIPTPASLVTAACDLSVIWVADVLRPKILQYAVNPTSNLLEFVGTLDLPFPPDAIALGDSGNYGIAINRELREVSLFGNDPGVTRSVAQSIVGNKDVRSVQRLLSAHGFQVGSIDGIYGARTRRAVELFEKKHQLKLGLPNDISGAIEKLESTTTKY